MPVPSPRLLLGPMLRYVDETCATVWVETDVPCTVEVRAGSATARAGTFSVEGCSYALVLLEGLPSGVCRPYEVRLDDRVVWPDPRAGLPPSEVRTLGSTDGGFRLTFGSCRSSAPHEAPYTRSRLLHRRGRGVDALRALASRMVHDPEAPRPDLLLLVGDQVYADENLPPQVHRELAQRRLPDEGPGHEIADWDEYVLLYRDAFGDPLLRWLLSTVPSAMIFDDHDVRDDWNTSAAWLARVRAHEWWQPRIEGALMSYWVYQHLGNLSPADLASNGEFAALQRCAEAGEDGGPVLRAHARRADVEETRGGHPDVRWSYRRDLGASRLVVLDSRAGRVLDPDDRAMLDDAEWAWAAEQLTGDVEHLLVASSLPVLMPEAVHHLEGWDEAVVAGAWGERWSRWGEWIRQAVDLEHWAAFSRSFSDLVDRLAEVARGQHGRAPSSVLMLSGDVHFGYLAPAAPEDGEPFHSRVWQAVSSPIRNPQDPAVRVAQRVTARRTVVRALRRLARSAGAPAPPVRWTPRHGPWFDNQVMTVVLTGPEAHVEVDTAHRGPPERALRRQARVRLA